MVLKTKYNNIECITYGLFLYENNGIITRRFEPCCYYKIEMPNGEVETININITNIYDDEFTVFIQINTLIIKEHNGIIERNEKVFECQFNKENFNEIISDENNEKNNIFYSYLETVDITAL